MSGLHLFNILSVSSFGVAAVMYKRQNTPGKLGGPISLAKAFWLHYTILTWFFILPAALLMLEEAPVSHRNVWLTLTVSMWIRGVVELYMLFVSKNWTPYIGISHDVITLAAMVGALLISGTSRFSTEPVLLIFTVSIFLSLCTEIYYAYSFFQIMKGRTQGDDGLWYAHEEDPRFKRVILVTTIFNYILFAALATFYLKYFIKI